MYKWQNHNSYFMTKLGLLDKPNDLDFWYT